MGSRYAWRVEKAWLSSSPGVVTALAIAVRALTEGGEVTADGVVRYAGVHSSYGNYLRILHENGDETLYAHLQYLFVHTGQIVFAGECLGTVGRTGNATGPHLHFELLHKGIRYDPTEALQTAS